MAGYQGYNPYGGYGMPAQMAQPYTQAAQQAYMQQMQAMGQMAPQQIQTQPSVVTRLVTSRDEATTAQITFDNTINLFVNLAAGEIYMKRFDPNTGGAIFADFVDARRMRQEGQEATRGAPEYVTMQSFRALEERVSSLAEAVRGRCETGGREDG